MQNQHNIIDCYEKTAANYARQFAHELHLKPLDSLLLKSFAEHNKSKGLMLDLGCGPGQTTNFLFENGANDILGTDISTGMISQARNIFPGVPFMQMDMLSLDYADASLGSVLAFYSIVHLSLEQIDKLLTDLKRMIIPGGDLLLAFHIGNETIHRDEFLEETVDIDFYFFEKAAILNLLSQNGFQLRDCIERFPYPEIEYPSNRPYIWASRTTYFPL